MFLQRIFESDENEIWSYVRRIELEREAEITKMFKTPVKGTKRAIINMFKDVKEDVNMMKKKMEVFYTICVVV